MKKPYYLEFNTSEMWRVKKILNNEYVRTPMGKEDSIEYDEKLYSGDLYTRLIFHNIDEKKFRDIVKNLTSQGARPKYADTQLTGGVPIQEEMKLINIIKSENPSIKAKLKQLVREVVKEERNRNLSGDYGGSSKYPDRNEETVRLDALQNYPFEHGENYEETAANYKIYVPSLRGRMNKDGSMDGINKNSMEARLNPDFNPNLKNEGWGIWAWAKDFEEKFGDATFKVSSEQFKERQIEYRIEVIENEEYFNQVDMWDKKHAKSHGDKLGLTSPYGNKIDKWS
tara:strand:+ start:67 stop:918 length:852 start_codon:yes stop_codon:yes gene_type:complete